MPIARAQLREIIAKDVAAATGDQRELIEAFSVQPYLAPIQHDPRHQHVWVAAQLGDLVAWYDDVEAGWNVSSMRNGVILEAGYEQDDLGAALLKGMGRSLGRT